MKAVIIANGNIKKQKYFSQIINRADLIICADGGASHLKKMGILPHVIIGDLDSLNLQDTTFFKNNNIKIIKHPVDKDVTDTELAAVYAVEQNCHDITFIGATGSRLDHTLANIFLLKKTAHRFADQKMAGQKIQCRIIDDNNEIFLVTDKITLTKEKNSFISILPLTEIVKGVTTLGLKYPLNNAKIKLGTSLGISNQFIDEKATISLKKGILIVIKSMD
ncbi:MAG: thiamine diphosphokinase [Desulfobacteraceae bacterium]|nr:thiamine diphosphokinase [Desulfobacteraceae bacterium]